MTFREMKNGRIFLAVLLIAIVSTILFVMLYTGYMFSRVWDTVTNMDPDLSQEEQNQILMDEVEKINSEISDNPDWLNNLIIAQWVATALTTFIIAMWTARRHAISQPQGVGYGVAIGIGSMLFYGLCAFSGSINFMSQLALMALLVAFSGMGGQIGGNAAKRRALVVTPSAGMPAHRPAGQMPPGMLSTPTGGDATMYYNMGVTAAMGGRREEARQHFGRVLQYEPRNVPAWLQLANLADTPEQAWEYIEQARAISPADPSVVQAVNVIWPQVKDKIRPSSIHSQPPYRGGAMDDTDIPRTTLPDLNEPDEILPPDANGGDNTDDVS